MHKLQASVGQHLTVEFCQRVYQEVQEIAKGKHVLRFMYVYLFVETVLNLRTPLQMFTCRRGQKQ